MDWDLNLGFSHRVSVVRGGRDDDGGKFAFINSASYHPTRKLHSSHEVAKIAGGGVRPALPVWLPYQPWQSPPASWKQIAYLDAAQLSHWPVSLEFYSEKIGTYLQLPWHQLQ